MKDNIEDIFKKLENQFDIEEPTIGHFDRFEAKLNRTKKSNSKIKLFSYVAVAASIILLFGVWIGDNYSSKGMELANISSEMGETQSYFVTVIERELETVENERDSNTEQIINDALLQIKRLEKQYGSLTLELKESTEDKRIIYAMISNFQKRIDVLQNLLTQIKIIKNSKPQQNEKYV
jgi:hypothetical protein